MELFCRYDIIEITEANVLDNDVVVLYIDLRPDQAVKIGNAPV